MSADPHELARVGRESFLFVADRILPVAMDLLPPQMRSSRGRAMVLATCLQESRFTYRVQMGGGPAHGFGQFEGGQGQGVHGVLTHRATRPVLLPILETLRIEPNTRACYEAIVYHDVLALVFVRLLLWTDARSLPFSDDEELGWKIYLDNWRPGQPKRATWPTCFQQAWNYLLEKGLT